MRDQDTAKEGTMELNFSPVMPVHTTHTAAKPQGLTWPAFKNKQNSQARDKPQCIHMKNMATLRALFFSYQASTCELLAAR